MHIILKIFLSFKGFSGTIYIFCKITSLVILQSVPSLVTFALSLDLIQVTFKAVQKSNSLSKALRFAVFKDLKKKTTKM